MANRLSLRLISFFIIITFLGQDLVWAEAGSVANTSVLSWSQVTKSKNEKNEAKTLGAFNIPSDSALTRKISAGPAQDIIINIQDAHQKLGAQESITKILDTLVKNYNLSLITVEGSTDRIDTSLIQSFPVEEVRKKTAEYYLKTGRISAAGFYSMISQDPLAVYGVDDKALYGENLKAFKDLIDKKPLIRVELKKLKGLIRTLEERIYSKELLDLTKGKLLHRKGDLKFT